MFGLLVPIVAAAGILPVIGGVPDGKEWRLVPVVLACCVGALWGGMRANLRVTVARDASRARASGDRDGR